MSPEAEQMVDLLSRVVWRRLQDRARQDKLARQKQEGAHASRPVRAVQRR